MVADIVEDHEEIMDLSARVAVLRAVGHTDVEIMGRLDLTISELKAITGRLQRAAVRLRS